MKQIEVELVDRILVGESRVELDYLIFRATGKLIVRKGLEPKYWGQIGEDCTRVLAGEMPEHLTSFPAPLAAARLPRHRL